MIAGIVLVTAILVFAMQVMQQSETGTRPSITIATQFNIPADRAFTDWPIVDQVIHFIINDAQLWILLVLAAAVIYWVLDWIDEKLTDLCRRGSPPLPVAAET
jgi:hypothetical protein